MKHLDTVVAPIRFADVDMAQIVHNAAYFHYLEHTRIVWFQKHLPHWNWSKVSTLVAKNEINYKAPVKWGDRLEVKLYTKQIGQKSIHLYYEGFVGDQQIFDGTVVLVCFDLTKNQTTNIPEEWMALL